VHGCQIGTTYLILHAKHDQVCILLLSVMASGPQSPCWYCPYMHATITTPAMIRTDAIINILMLMPHLCCHRRRVQSSIRAAHPEGRQPSSQSCGKRWLATRADPACDDAIHDHALPPARSHSARLNGPPQQPR
jgi:hypothetical protein